MSEDLDRRLNAVRPDLADARLKGKVEAKRFAEGRRRRVTAATAAIRCEPRPDSPLDTEMLFGEEVRVFDEAGGWAWCQSEIDGYVGYMPASSLAADVPAPTHRLAALRTFLFPGPDLKLPPLATLSLGSRLALTEEEVVTRGTPYRLLVSGGSIPARNAVPLDAPATGDFVAVAERLVGTPYLWGGRSALGIDCSGLVQLSLAAAGRSVLRDTDMQEKSLGPPIPAGDPYRRGDLVFWPGHVGIMVDAQHLIHANGYHMAVAVEPLHEAVTRIARGGGAISSVRRL
jgi:cell wall-associated NlpC family hydrolase